MHLLGKFRKSHLKLALIGLTATVGLGVFLFSDTGRSNVHASVLGPSPSFTGAPDENNCTACHSSYAVNSGTGSVTIAGVPRTYRPGQQFNVTVTTAQEDAVIYGFQLTSLNAAGGIGGTLAIPTQSPAQMQLVDGFVNTSTRKYVEHTQVGTVPTMFGSKSWSFTWTAPAAVIGRVGFYAAGNGANSDGGNSGDYIYTTAASSRSTAVRSSFDTDNKSDIAVFRPSSGTWYSLNSKDQQFVSYPFGLNGDKAVPGDYDGDGITDRAVFRPSSGVWYVQQSTAGFTAVAFGISTDIPAQADYDGDGKTDFAVYRPSTGMWYLQRSTAGFAAFSFGIAEDKPVAGDYDGDGKDDVAVFRPSTGTWYLQRSSAGFAAYSFGLSGDRAMPADFDGDGKRDIAVYRPSSGTWYMQRSTAGFGAAQFGASSDIPSPADLDDDGKDDIIVFRPSNGTWYAIKSADSSFFAAAFGTSGDTPVPSAYTNQ